MSLIDHPPLIAEASEKAVISAILRSAANFLPRLQANGITEDCFHSIGRKITFRRLLSMPLDAIEVSTLAQELDRHGELEDVGGTSTLSELVTYEPGGQKFDYHIQQLKEYQMRRTVELIAKDIHENSATQTPEGIAKLGEKITDVARASVGQSSQVVSITEVLSQILTEMKDGNANNGLQGFSTSIESIDSVTGGLTQGALWVIAGGTSAGKSVLMLQMANSIIGVGGRVLIVSLEMTTKECLQRITCCRSGVSFLKLTGKERPNKSELTKISDAFRMISSAKIEIDEAGGHDMDAISQIVHGFTQRHGGVDLVVIDYAQLVEPGKRSKNDTQATEIGDAVKAMKNLAKRHKCAVLTGSQLNDQKKLFGSRSIAHHADVLLTINETNIIGEKVRNGVRGLGFQLTLNGAAQKFE